MVAKALVLTAISTGLQVVGKLKEASAARGAAEFEAQQLQYQKDLAALEGIQSENQQRQELAIALATQSAQAAAQGLDLGGGSFQAIQRDTRFKTTQNINNIALMGSLKARQYSLGIKQTLDAGKATAQSAIFGALGSLASAGASVAETGVFDTGSGFNPAKQAPPRKPF